MDSPGWLRFFPLFLRHGLIPEPDSVKKLREDGARELAEMGAGSSRQVGVRNVAEREELRRKREADLVIEVEAARRDVRNYARWAPSGDDWMRLAIGLAIKHAESGFQFNPPRPAPGPEAAWHRDNLMLAIIARDGVDAKTAAVTAAREIDVLHKKGTGREYGTKVSAGTLRTGFSQRSRLRDGMRTSEYWRRPEAFLDDQAHLVPFDHRSEMPHYMRSFLALETHFAEILEEAKSLSPD